MKKLFGPAIALFMTLNSTHVGAESNFATVETVRSQNSMLVVTSLSADSSTTVNRKGIYSFSGYIDNQAAGRVVPLTVEIDSFGLNTAPTINDVAEITGKVSINNSFSFTTKFGGIKVKKTLISLVVKQDNSSSTMILTDDPVPVIAWLALAGLVSLTGVSIYYVEKCKKVKLTTSADLKKLKLETILVCEN